MTSIGNLLHKNRRLLHFFYKFKNFKKPTTNNYELKKVVLLVLFAISLNSFGQNSVTEINTKSGVHYYTTTVDFPITGTYLFEGAEPIVVLNANGTGIYQLHDQPKRPVVWGIECNKAGEPKFIEGFDSAAYTLWYSFTDGAENGEMAWFAVEFSIHFNTEKMYIQGERMKLFTDDKK